jgi:MFS superfamily sulfate permease-like transporter
MEEKPDASPRANLDMAAVRGDVVAGLVSSTVAIPLAMAFGMFAFVTLGDEYFAYGAMAGLMSAFIAGVVCVVRSFHPGLCAADHHNLLPRPAALFPAASRHRCRR